jgi:hypothetical protein
MRTLFAGLALATMLLASATAAAPGPPTQYVRKTSGPVLALAADGDRAAFIVEGRVPECWSVMVWEPTRRRIERLESAAKCESTDRLNRRGAPTLALAGSRAAWLQLTGGNTLETILKSATVAHPTPRWVAGGYANDGVAGTFVRPPVGESALLVFTHEAHCHPDYQGALCPPGKNPGDIVNATVWRLGGRGRCPGVIAGKPFPCTPVVKADGELTALAVDSGRIAARTESGIRLLTTGGRILQDPPVRATAAALSGNRLAVRMRDAVEVYDIGSGKLTDRFVAAKRVRLQDLERDILVTASGSTFTLRRLGNRRTGTIRVNRTTLARLEPPGLFFTAGARRVAFMPMREVLRRLGG